MRSFDLKLIKKKAIRFKEIAKARAYGDKMVEIKTKE